MDFEKEYPKTHFAMMALASAVAEETAGEKQLEVGTVASVAIAGTAMKLASIVVGDDVSKESFGPEAAEECIRLLYMCLDGTIHTMTEVKDEAHAN